MCYLVETVLPDNIVHSISELEGALEMIAKPPSRCPSPPLGQVRGLYPRETKELSLSSSGRHHQAHTLQLPVQAACCASRPL